MEHDREWAMLRAGQVPQGSCDGSGCFSGDLVGHVGPAAIAHVVDVAVTAIDVAAAGDLDEDGVEFDHTLAPAPMLLSGNGYAGCASGYRLGHCASLRCALLR